MAATTNKSKEIIRIQFVHSYALINIHYLNEIDYSKLRCDFLYYFYSSLKYRPDINHKPYIG